jgi:SNF2 family DNA or RNA helicase
LLLFQVYGGDVNERAELRARWAVQGRDAVQLCLCSFRQAWEDRQHFQKQRWRNLVIDSTHMQQEDLPFMKAASHSVDDTTKAIGDDNTSSSSEICERDKNRRGDAISSTQSTDAWCSLLPFFPSERRILLSDGPLPCTLYSLFAWACFLMPHLFPTVAGLRRWLRSRAPGSRSHKVKALLSERDMSGDVTLVEQMQELVRPFFLRRCLRPLEKLWPRPVHSIVACDLTQKQCDACTLLVESAEAKESLKLGNLHQFLVLLFRLRRILNYKGRYPTYLFEFWLFLIVDDFRSSTASMFERKRRSHHRGERF